MTPNTTTVRQLLAALGASLAVLVAAGPAGAAPDGFQPQLQESDAVSRYLDNHRRHEEAQNAQVSVIPYLSHGILEPEQALRASGAEAPDGYQPQLRGVDAVRGVESDTEWNTGGFVAGVLTAAILAGLMAAFAFRPRSGGVASA